MKYAELDPKVFGSKVTFKENNFSPPPEPSPQLRIFGVLGSNIPFLSERHDLVPCLKALSYPLDLLNPCNKMSECLGRLNICCFVPTDLSGTLFFYAFPLLDWQVQKQRLGIITSDRQGLKHNTISMTFLVRLHKEHQLQQQRRKTSFPP